MNVNQAIDLVIREKNLGESQAYSIAREIMKGKLTGAQIGALLTALRMKGETVDEITGFARAMREKAVPVVCKNDSLVDTCGTGGDRAGTFNVSTVAAFIAAGAGCRVAKHGNRSVSSSCGSADVLEALGVNVNISPEHMGHSIDTVGVGFLFAPILHRAMKYVIGPRREMGVRTIFNILGPLTNPAGAKRQLLGVYCKDRVRLLAQVLRSLGSYHCLIVHGEDGLDEITITGKTFMCEIAHNTIRKFTVSPGDFGMQTADSESIKGGDTEVNAGIALDILNGIVGPKRDIAVLNAGAAIYVAGKADTIGEGIRRANISINSGKARAALQQLKEFTR